MTIKKCYDILQTNGYIGMVFYRKDNSRGKRFVFRYYRNRRLGELLRIRIPIHPAFLHIQESVEKTKQIW